MRYFSIVIIIIFFGSNDIYLLEKNKIFILIDLFGDIMFLFLEMFIDLQLIFYEMYVLEILIVEILCDFNLGYKLMYGFVGKLQFIILLV